MFNPEAAGVSPRVRDVIAHALSSELKLDVAETKRRHHATHLAAGAAHEGFDAVVVLGGDGTLNEVINGLVGTGVPVIPIPGGGTNVFARTLGLPKDPIEATSVVLEHLREGAQPRSINLGRVNGRAFAFCAGVGTNAAIVRSVERRAKMKKSLGEALFVFKAVSTFVMTPRRRPALTLQIEGTEIGRLHDVIVCNSDPFTFLGARPFRLCPDASFDTGLDLLGLRSIRTPFLLRTVFAAFGDQRHRRFRNIEMLHDVESFTITATRPVPLQVDGDFDTENSVFEFTSVPNGLSVLC